jgi:hypothetical protein
MACRGKKKREWLGRGRSEPEREQRRASGSPNDTRGRGGTHVSDRRSHAACLWLVVHDALLKAFRFKMSGTNTTA